MDREAFRTYLEFIWYCDDEGIEKPSRWWRFKTRLKILLRPNCMARYLRRLEEAKVRKSITPYLQLTSEEIEHVREQGDKEVVIQLAKKLDLKPGEVISINERHFIVKDREDLDGQGPEH